MAVFGGHDRNAEIVQPPQQLGTGSSGVMAFGNDGTSTVTLEEVGRWLAGMIRSY